MSGETDSPGKPESPEPPDGGSDGGSDGSAADRAEGPETDDIPDPPDEPGDAASDLESPDQPEPTGGSEDLGLVEDLDEVEPDESEAAEPAEPDEPDEPEPAQGDELRGPEKPDEPEPAAVDERKGPEQFEELEQADEWAESGPPGESEAPKEPNELDALDEPEAPKEPEGSEKPDGPEKSEVTDEPEDRQEPAEPEKVHESEEPVEPEDGDRPAESQDPDDPEPPARREEADNPPPPEQSESPGFDDPEDVERERELRPGDPRWDGNWASSDAAPASGPQLASDQPQMSWGHGTEMAQPEGLRPMLSSDSVQPTSELHDPRSTEAMPVREPEGLGDEPPFGTPTGQTERPEQPEPSEHAEPPDRADEDKPDVRELTVQASDGSEAGDPPSGSADGPSTEDGAGEPDEGAEGGDDSDGDRSKDRAGRGEEVREDQAKRNVPTESGAKKAADEQEDVAGFIKPIAETSTSPQPKTETRTGTGQQISPSPDVHPGTDPVVDFLVAVGTVAAMAKQRKDQRAADKSVSPETDGPKAPGGDEPTRSERAEPGEPDQPSAYPERDDPVRGRWTPGESRTYVSLGRVGEGASGPESRSADDDSGSERVTPPDGGDDDSGGGDGGGDGGDDGGGDGGGDQPVAAWQDPDNKIVAHVRHTEDGPKVRIEQANDPAGDRSALKADRGEERKEDPLERVSPKDSVERTLAKDGDTLADRMSEQVEAGLSVGHSTTRTGQDCGPPQVDAPGHTDLVSVDQVTGLAFTLAAIAARVAGIIKRARGD